MTPDYTKAAEKAVDTVSRFGINPEHPDPALVLRQMRNVVLIPYASDGELLGDNQDAFTLVNRENGELQYIIIYNQALEPVPLRLALSRELGHIILEHDGNNPESVWMEEAICFAYHFLCPLPLLHEIRARGVPINYRPKRHSLSWEMKDSQRFDNMDDMLAFVINERNIFARYVGSRVCDYKKSDIELRERCKFEQLTGWKNCYDIILNGNVIGYCGE